MMRWIILLVLCSSVLADEIEWVDPQEKILRMDEHVVRDGFIIEASDFYDNAVLITVYDHNNTILARNITYAGEFMVMDEINITVLDLQMVKGNIGAIHGINVTIDQWVKIQTRLAGKPAPIVSIIPYERMRDNKTIVRHVFSPGEEILMNFSIKNEGKAVLKNVSLRINSTLPLLSGERLNYDLDELKREDAEVITVGFKAPLLKERKTFTISAELKGNDILKKEYKAVDSTHIEVVPQIEKTGDIMLKKYVSEKVYIGDIAVVTISIKNNMGRNIDITLVESLPAGIEPLNTNLTWNLSLQPYEQKSISYKIKPTKPGIYIFPAGSSQVKYHQNVIYNAQSNRLVVSGPYVVLKKSASSTEVIKGENLTITIEAKNIGDITAMVRLRDDVPSNYTLSEKEMRSLRYTMILRPGEKALISYVLNTPNIGSFALPPAKGIVYDQFLYTDERYTQRAISNILVINVSKSTTIVTQVKKTPVKVIKSKSIKSTKAYETSSGLRKYFMLLISIIRK